MADGSAPHPATTTLDGIAIVGMAGRFPAARSTDELWSMLAEGREATRWPTDEELLAAGVSPDDLADPNYVKATLVLPDMEAFDGEFFGFSPREAKVLDPQHRHFLEVCWEALEHAGHAPRRFEGAIGVFGGCGMQSYFARNILTNRDLMRDVGLFLLRHTGNDKDFLTSRVSYLFDLKGPSVAVQTACSTSLVAVHLAAQSLLAGECDMALAGGVSIEVPHRQGYHYAEGEILARDGHCRTFDDKATGTLFGSGAGVVVLRRLDDALRDGDTIHAVIRGSAVNNDGASKAGYLAPSVEGQARAMAEALAIAGVDASAIDYVEAHGTGTLIGDPIELSALTEVYGASAKPGSIGIGSIKTNIGHLDTAAGVASLIKVVMAMRHCLIPRSLNCDTPNTRFDFDKSPFRVAMEAKPWPRRARPRRAAINSLGVGGTNAHVVIEEPPARSAPATATSSAWQIILTSAKSQPALERTTAALRRFAETPDRPALGDAVYTTHVGRDAFAERRAIIARDWSDIPAALAPNALRRTIAGRAPTTPPGVVFMFPGGGAQFPGAGYDLYHTEPAFRAAADACLAELDADLANLLRGSLFGDARLDPAAAQMLERPLASITAVFIIEYAVSKLWAAWGVKPAAVIGHSAGDYAAAVTAGVLSMSDALAIVVARGRIFEALPPGGMIVVDRPEAETRALAGGDLDVAVLNATDMTVLSGPVDALDRVTQRATAAGAEVTRVRINVAAHSRMLEPHLAGFREMLSRIHFAAPTLPFMSNLDGDWARADSITTPDYWVRHLRNTVRFGDGLARILDEPNRVMLECGPGHVLSAIARGTRAKHAPVATITSCRSAQEADDDRAIALLAAGALWAHGVDVDLAALRPAGQHARVPLPTYPFERTHHWIDAPVETSTAAAAPAQSTKSKIERIADRDAWFSAIHWHEVPRVAKSAAGERWLVLDPQTERARAILTAARAAGVEIVTATDTATTSDVETLHRLVQSAIAGRRLDRIVDLNPTAAASRAETDFHRLFALAEALQRDDASAPLALTVITQDASSAGRRNAHNAERLALLGALRVLPREFTSLTTRLIDTDGVTGAADIVAEIAADAADSLVALVDGRRYCETIQRIAIPAAAASRIKTGGVYLITGGFGGIGRLLARHLATRHGARLALVGRTGASSDAAQRLVSELETAGSEVLSLAADITSEAETARAIEAARARFGRIDGIIHAAGRIDDAPVGIKTHSAADTVLAPKLAGTRNLSKLAPLGSLDLFAVFSSTSALLGPPGQIDYAAANTAAEAIALARPDGLVLTWGIWSDTGMGLAARRSTATLPAGPQLHPLLGVRRPGDTIAFESIPDADDLWVLDGHRIASTPVLPATAYLEIARAALHTIRPGAAMTLDDAEVLEAFAETAGRPRRLVTTLKPRADGSHTLLIESTTLTGSDEATHFRARIAPSATAFATRPVDARAKPVLAPEAAHMLQSDVVDFGARWNTILDVTRAGDAVTARLALAPAFRGETAMWRLHPALLDMAATIGLHLLDEHRPAGIVYAPVAVRHLDIAASLPAEITARANIVGREPGVSATFDVTLTTPDGAPVATITGLVMRALDTHRLADTAASVTGDPLDQLLASGIRRADADHLFARAFASPERRIIISSIPLAAIRALYVARNTPGATARPASANAPAAFANAIEARLATMFGELLGVEQVGPDDEFLALGGHSLAAVRLFARMRKEWNVDLPLAILFEAPSVRALAAEIVAAAGLTPEPIAAPEAETSIKPATAPAETTAALATAAPARPRGKPWSPLVRLAPGIAGARPVFCVHGAGGNVFSGKPLADIIGRTHPFYGLQAQGVDGTLPFHETIEEMAECYLAAIETIDDTGPYAFIGYSGGGVIIYEMAHRLRAKGRDVSVLAAIDTLAPSAAQARSRPSDWIAYAREIGVLQAADEIAMTILGKSRSFVEARLPVRFQTKLKIDPLQERANRLFATFLEAQRRYQMRPLDADLMLFRAARPSVHFHRAGPMLGWERHVTGRIHVQAIDADHDTIVASANAGLIADAIMAAIGGDQRQPKSIGSQGRR